MQSNRRFFFAALVVTALFVALAVASSVSAARAGRLAVAFTRADGSLTPQFSLLVVSTYTDRQRGLMYVKELPKDEGMLFVFPESKEQQFWMKNTYVSLDLIFINEDRLVVGVKERAVSMSTQRLSVPRPAQYVIELVAGSAADNGITPGAKVEFYGPVPEASS